MSILSGKIILITGAAGSIGAAVAAAVRDAGGTSVTADLKAGAGIDHALDVTDEAQWQTARRCR